MNNESANNESWDSSQFIEECTGKKKKKTCFDSHQGFPIAGSMQIGYGAHTAYYSM
jgi:hypothetical protein